MRLFAPLLGAASLLCFVPAALAQDAVAVDAKHYTVVSENDQVRILKIHYGPHEKSVMHSHPDSVAVYLTDGSVKMTDAEGKTAVRPMKAGDAEFTPKSTHLPENTTDRPMELILVELKSH